MTIFTAIKNLSPTTKNQNIDVNSIIKKSSIDLKFPFYFCIL